jgi:hypothetical protein
MAISKTDKAKALATNVGRVSSAAFNSGEARARLLATVADVCGKKPTLSLYNSVKLAAVVGFMASALARKGDNRTEEALIAHCRDRVLNYQGASGKGKLRAGQKGRRTQTEEDAYASARVLSSRIFADAGVTVPEARGGDRSKTGKAAENKKGATGKQTPKKDAANDKPAVRTFKAPEKMVAYALIQGKAMQATLNRSAAHTPERLGTAINHFLSEVIAVAQELGLQA